MELSDSEKYIVEIMRELRPYEQITIVKDSQGRPEAFLIKREQKVMTSKLAIVAVK